MSDGVPGDGDDTVQAASISCTLCDFCAAVHVNLFDKQGRLFASANVPVSIGPQFIQQFRDCLQRAALRVDAPARRQ